MIGTHRSALLTAAAVFLLALLLPLFISGYGTRILNLAFISAIAVVGLNFAFGYAGLITLAQAGFVGCGAYGTAILTTTVGLSPWLSIPLATAFSGLVAVAIGLPLLRLKGHYLALATLGFNVSFGIVATNWKSLMGGTDGISGIPALELGAFSFGTDQRYFYVLWIALVAATWVAWRIRSSHVGLAMIAVRDDEIATATSSVGVTRIKVQAFALSAVYAGLAGALFAHMTNFIAPDDFAVSHSIIYLAMLIIGGEGSIVGAIVGAIIVTFMPELMRDLGTAYMIFFGCLMLLILIFLPKGLLSLVMLVGRRLGKDLVVSDAILTTDGLSKTFGGVRAVQAVSFSVPRGQIFSVIGPNGAGKTTLINVMTGILRSSGGAVRFDDRDITDAQAHTIAAAGMVRTFQNGRLFPRLSVIENVMVGAYHRLPQTVWSVILGSGTRRRMNELRQRSQALLNSLELGAYADHLVGSLPYGRQRMVEIARALISEPKLLLLDEPAAGLNSGEVETLRGILEGLRTQGITLILVEHNMGLVMRVADRIVVISFGEKIAEGTPMEVRAEPKVLEAYLGRGYVHAQD